MLIPLQELLCVDRQFFIKIEGNHIRGAPGLDPGVYYIYMLKLFQIITTKKISYHADDTQFYIILSPGDFEPLQT